MKKILLAVAGLALAGGVPVVATGPAGAASSEGRAGARSCPPQWRGATTNVEPSISADGRYVAFDTYSPDDIDTRDVMLRDLRHGTTTPLTRSPAGTSASSPVISDDGLRVAYLRHTTTSDTLMAYDRRTGRTTAEGAADSSEQLDISADGRFVVFGLTRSLGPDGGTTADVYLRDVDRNTTTLVSRTASGVPGHSSSSDARISADGRYVLFESGATDLAPGATGGLYVRDLRRGVTSIVPGAAGGQADGSFGDLSPDGRYVVYDDLTHIVRVDRSTGVTTTVSPAEADDHHNREGLPSDRGRFVAYDENYLVGGDAGDAFAAVVVHQVSDGSEATVNAGPDGLQPWTSAYLGAITPDARYVAFYTDATNLSPADANFEFDVYVTDLKRNTVTLVSAGKAGGYC